jgi:nucleoprotein TPR
LQKARAADAERASSSQLSAVTAAVEKAKADMQATDSSVVELAKRHDVELRELQERLTAKQQEMKEALEGAQSAQKSQESSSGADKDIVDAAINAHKAAIQQSHADDIAAAVERGRMEQAAKGKLKDAQLVRAQNKLKELEAKVLEWRKAGILPEDAPPPTPTSATAGPSAPTNPSATPATGSAALPRKPSIAASATPTDGAGRGRGASRGVRGVQRGLGIRGAAPGRGAPAASPTATTGGVSILGAASKRAREDGGSPDDSLAKRLKPAEGGGAGTTTGKPVTLRRDRLPPPAS